MPACSRLRRCRRAPASPARTATTLRLSSGQALPTASRASAGSRAAAPPWPRSSYTLDAIGNRTQRVDGLGTHTYAYDALYRLTSVTYPGPSTDTYTYDANGNRLTKNSTNLTYDAADRLTALGAVSYGYDSNGNLTSRGSDTFSWDAADRLTSATVSSVTTTFAYNPSTPLRAGSFGRAQGRL